VTPTVNETTRDFILSRSVDDVTTTVGLVVIALLVALLVAQELARAAGGPRVREQVRALGAPAFPLLAAFAVVIMVRAAELL
jgi:hypothetical protein